MAIVAAFKNGETKVYTKSAHQFDKGQRLIVAGVPLPSTYEVHISNEKEGGMASSLIGNLEGVLIPDAYFVNGDFIYVWIYAVDREDIGSPDSIGYQMGDDSTLEQVKVGAEYIDEGTTVYEIVIPIIKRSIQLPTMAKTTQEQQVIGYIVDENNALVPVIQ